MLVTEKIKLTMALDFHPDKSLAIGDIPKSVIARLMEKYSRYPYAEITCDILNPEGSWSGYILEQEYLEGGKVSVGLSYASYYD